MYSDVLTFSVLISDTVISDKIIHTNKSSFGGLSNL